VDAAHRLKLRSLVPQRGSDARLPYETKALRCDGRRLNNTATVSSTSAVLAINTSFCNYVRLPMPSFAVPTRSKLSHSISAPVQRLGVNSASGAGFRWNPCGWQWRRKFGKRCRQGHPTGLVSRAVVVSYCPPAWKRQAGQATSSQRHSSHSAKAMCRTSRGLKNLAASCRSTFSLLLLMRVEASGQSRARPGARQRRTSIPALPFLAVRNLIRARCGLSNCSAVP
jgi:hypothetical protein